MLDFLSCCIDFIADVSNVFLSDAPWAAGQCLLPLTLFSSSLIPVTFYLRIWKTNQEADLSWPHKDPSSPLQLPSAHTLCVLSNSWLISRTLKIRVRLKIWICLSSLLSKRKMRRRKENWKSDWSILFAFKALFTFDSSFNYLHFVIYFIYTLDYLIIISRYISD